MSIFDTILNLGNTLVNGAATYLGFQAKKAQGEAQVEQARAEAARAEAEAYAEAMRGDKNARSEKANFERQLDMITGVPLNQSLAQKQSMGDGPPIIINQAPAQKADSGFFSGIGGQILVGVTVAIAVAAFTGGK